MEEELGVEKDKNEAMFWYKFATESGDSIAKEKLKGLKEGGWVERKNNEKPVRLDEV